jgi:F-type H+-transporting ATPase subunit a
LIATIFLFVLANNWLGLIPGTGTIGIYEIVHGQMELVPLLRPAGSDMNFTLALAVVTVIVSHFAGIRAVGFIDHLSKFVNVKGIWKSLRKGPMAIATAVIEFGVGFIEILGEFAKTLSLSLRLFGNVLAGEILMGVMLGLVSYVVPIPFIFLEILVGIVQATVFAMLSLVYLMIATTPHGSHDEPHHEAAAKH